MAGFGFGKIPTNTQGHGAFPSLRQERPIQFSMLGYRVGQVKAAGGLPIEGARRSAMYGLRSANRDFRMMRRPAFKRSI